MTKRLFLSRQQSRQVDEIAIHQLGFPGVVLMENAGRGVVDVMVAKGIRGPVSIACGKGNNAGDGFVIARQLLMRGFEPTVWLWCDDADYSGDAAINLDILRSANVPIEHCENEVDWHSFRDCLNQSDWIIEALLGTGAVGAPRPPYDRVIREMNRAPAGNKLAIDVPSGLDCDTGEADEPTFQASVTCTFVARKLGFDQEKSAAYLGDVQVVDIGMPLDWVISRLTI